MLFWIIRDFFNIALFRTAPEDLPANSQTLVLAIAFALFSYTIAGAFAAGLVYAFMQGLVDMLVSAVFIYAVLQVQGRLNRFYQTYSALAGSAATINIFAAPLLLTVTDGAMPALASILLLLLFTWSLALCAYIFRHAFEITQRFSVIVAVLYVLLVISITQWILPS